MKATVYILLFLALCGFAQAQDKIKLKTGDIIKGRVIKIAGGKVIYKKFSSKNGPDVSVPKADVEYIKYASGKIAFMDAKVKVKTTPKKKVTVKTK
ncbi:MAG: hypothetical protein K0S12_2540 [Bacteroidetes bacterium]|jgi:hypothetical protein|nr:hypothetical protein [Bacteroidota bacterium]